MGDAQGHRQILVHHFFQHLLIGLESCIALVGYVIFDAELPDGCLHAREVIVGTVDLEHFFADALYERFGGAVDRVFKHLLSRAVLVDYSLVHKEDAGAHIAGELHLVGHDEHGHAFLSQLADDAEHFAHHGGVEGRRGFVEENNLRLHGQAAGDCYALLLTAGEAGRVDVGLFCKADFPKEGQAFFARLFYRFLLDLARGVYDILQHCHVIEEVETLEYHAHFLAHLVNRIAFLQNVFPVNYDTAAGRRVQQVERPQESAFPRPGRAYDADHLAGIDFAVYILQYLEAAAVRVVIGFAEMRNGNHSEIFLGVAIFSNALMSHTSKK